MLLWLKKAFLNMSRVFTTCNSVLSGHFTSQLATAEPTIITLSQRPAAGKRPQLIYLDISPNTEKIGALKYRGSQHVVSQDSLLCFQSLCREYEKSCGRRGDKDLVKLKTSQRTVLLVEYNVNI